MRLSEAWRRQATRAGLLAGGAALLLWPAYAILQGSIRFPFLAALLVTAGAGLSILIIAAADLLTIDRSPRVRPARVFDLALGGLLLVPSAAALSTMLS
jgi:hypothetical protein